MRSSDRRAQEFLDVCDQFKLGVLTTESSHPATASLSDAAGESIPEALKLLFDVDADVVDKYREWANSGAAERIAGVLVESLRGGRRIFFTGCGSTGRLSIQLDSIWRDFWQRRGSPGDWEDRTFSVMAGGDFALIKSVEGFEDYTQFGRKQIGDLGVGQGDVVFAITEGGETSFVIGTAWQALESGARVYFVYNNPDDVLREHVERSRQIIDEPGIEKINLTTGPMAITGSTRMQATTIQLCVMLTVLEMAARELTGEAGPVLEVPAEFARGLEQMHAVLQSAQVSEQLAQIVAMEEGVYRSGHINNYFASRLGIDVLTDTTERSPTYCVPPFKKRDGSQAAESWSFLFLPDADTDSAWRRILRREPRCVEWGEAEVRAMVGDEKAVRQYEIVKRISRGELMKFRIGLDGLSFRTPKPGDSAVGIVTGEEMESLRGGFHREQLEAAAGSGARVGLIFVGDAARVRQARELIESWEIGCLPVLLETPDNNMLLDGITRAGVKMLLNALSTCTMVRMGRVMGNYMIYVVPSNLKLIDRATRYISRLTDLSYREACHLLFEVIEYVEPRMKADQAYPPVVGVAVARARHGLTNEEAEESLKTRG